MIQAINFVVRINSRDINFHTGGGRTQEGSRLDQSSFDIVIVGGGPAGYALALAAGLKGKSVALVEKDKVGGTCLHRGCIPAKELLEASHLFKSTKNAGEFGVNIENVSLDFSRTQNRKQDIVDQLFKGLSGLLKSRKVEMFNGVGSLIQNREVLVNKSDGSSVSLLGNAVVLAMGSVPKSIPGFDIDGVNVLSSDEVLNLETVPKKVVVIGGGAIGCEFASMFNDFGSTVVLLEVAPTLLPGCDGDVSNYLSRSFKKQGIDARTGVKIVGYSKTESGLRVTLESGEYFDVDKIVVSVGRKPVTETLDPSSTGIILDSKGYVVVDEYMRTSAAGVWAIGDIVNTPQLAHIGFAEALVALGDILGEKVMPIDYSKVPWCIYSHPEVAFSGLSEESAREKGIDVVVKKDPLMGNSRAKIIGETDGVVKVIAKKGLDGKAGEIIGVHMVGPWVTEQLGAGYFAVNWGATVDDVAQLIQPHPTLSESFGETVLSLAGKGIHLG